MKRLRFFLAAPVLSMFLSGVATAETREDMLKSHLHSGNRSFIGSNEGHYYAALDTWGLTAEAIPSVTVSIEMEKIVISVEYDLFGQDILPEFQPKTQFTVIPIPNPGNRQVLARMKQGESVLPFLGDGPYRGVLDEMMRIQYAEEGLEDCPETSSTDTDDDEDPFSKAEEDHPILK